MLIASLVAIIAMASMALAGVLSSSRFIYAMAKDGVLPASLGELNERYKTPHWPILLTGLLMAVSIYSFDVHVIAELASGFILMVFIVLNLTVVVLRRAGPKHEWNPPYKFTIVPATPDLRHHRRDVHARLDGQEGPLRWWRSDRLSV